MENNMAFYNKYSKSLNELKLIKQIKEIKEKKIEVLYGVSGSGKTHKVYSDNKLDEIQKPKCGNSGIWLDGYNPE